MPTAAEARAHPILWAMYASNGTWFPAPHLWYLADMLMKVVRGEILRLCVSLPPQHGKSEFISKYFPTWLLGRFPLTRILQCSYGQDLTVEWTGAGRDLFAEHGPAVFGLDTWARSKRTAWNAYKDGRRLGGIRGVGKGGGVSGRPADYGFCDDLVKDHDDVSSLTQRDRTDKWFRSAVLPRARKLVTIGTRWHHDDVIGRMEERQRRGQVGDPWTFVNIPAVATGDDDPLGRARGQVLWPGNPLVGGDPDWYAKKEREVGPYVWSALYQGRPTPESGSLFEKRWLAYYDEDRGDFVAERIRVPSASLLRFLTVDPAWSKKTSADYSVVMAWGYDRANGRLFLLDVVRKRLTAPELEREIRDSLDRNGATLAYVEAQNLKMDEMQVLRRSIPMREIQPNTDKVARFMPVQGHASRGSLLFRRGAPWLGDLERELLEFGPACAHDDQVDAVSYGVHVANDMSRRVPVRRPGQNREGDGWLIGRE